MGAKIEPELAGTEPSTAPKMPDKRSLSEPEIDAARKVFGSSIKYESVRVEKMGGFTEVINGSRAYTLGNTINLPGKVHAYPHQYVSIIIHELTHVWQYQHSGWGYIPSALLAQTFGDGYDFGKALRQGKPWAKMNPEQQAQMIQDAFRGVYFDTPGALFGVFNSKGIVVRQGTQPPDGFADFTSALEEALGVLRKS